MMGLEFTVQTADIDETMDPSQTPAHEVAAVSARKAEKIAAQHPQDVIVSDLFRLAVDILIAQRHLPRLPGIRTVYL